mgnify:CR=1 FL=1
MNTKTFQIGDLVEFDAAHKLGIVIDIKTSTAFDPSEKVQDVKVRWATGKEFWCLEYTLNLLSSRNRY